MVYIVDTSMLITGILILVIGVILYFTVRYAPDATLSKIIHILAFVLMVIGVTLIIIALLMPLLTGALLILGV